MLEAVSSIFILKLPGQVQQSGVYNVVGGEKVLVEEGEIIQSNRCR